MYEDLKIIEIGRPYIKLALPQIRCFASRKKSPVENIAVEPFWKLPKALRERDLDLIVCHPSQNSPWNLRWWIRQIGKRDFLSGYIPFTSTFGPQLARFRASQASLAVLDLEDNRFIATEDLFLLKHCITWFKRELPVDHWQVFTRTGHASTPTARYRRRAFHQDRIDKLHPISLGLHPGHQQPFPATPPHKSTDIFFAGMIDGSSTVRTQGIAALQVLRDRGYRVDFAARPIAVKEFYQRAAQALLVWSPEGFGWDCHRHYEAALNWSVPLMNLPTIDTYQPFQHNVNAVYYWPSPQGLIEAAEQALSDRSKLIDMGRRAREHCLQHHSLHAIAKYVVETTMQVGRQHQSHSLPIDAVADSPTFTQTNSKAA